MALAPASHKPANAESSASTISSNTRITRSATRLAQVSAACELSRKRKIGQGPPTESANSFAPKDSDTIQIPKTEPSRKRQRLGNSLEFVSKSSGRPKRHLTMASTGPSSPSDLRSEVKASTSQESSTRRSGRNKKYSLDSEEVSTEVAMHPKRSKRNALSKPNETTSRGERLNPIPRSKTTDYSRLSQDQDELDQQQTSDDDEDDADDHDVFNSAIFGSGRMQGSMSETLRQLSGYVSGVTQRMRDIITNLQQKDDPTMRLIALQDLSELLLISNEDNLSGHFSTDQLVKQLVNMMQTNDFDVEDPEVMLLACRCLAHLIEALPSSTAIIVINGAVPVLCQKLLEINFIDLAEQALSTLEKISTEYPASIVSEGGLEACLNYLDFFATSTQRTAVTTAANCCKNIDVRSLPVIIKVIPTLLSVLSSHDQKVVEQGSICVSRIIESFKYEESALEKIVSVDLLRSIRRLLQPGSTNIIGAAIHTQFLRVLSITSKASPRLAAELLRMDIVETFYQILTGISPPTGLDDMASRIDGVSIMQTLAQRSREQITETLNVICELLPPLQTDLLSFSECTLDPIINSGAYQRAQKKIRTTLHERKSHLDGCKEQIKRFALIMFPTLTNAYSSTVNLEVRQKVLCAQLKMISSLEIGVVEAALQDVPFASFLASILSQREHCSLISLALQAADLLLKRSFKFYYYQFCREGVVAEISRLGNDQLNDSRLKQSDSSGVLTTETSMSKKDSITDVALEQHHVEEDAEEHNVADVEDDLVDILPRTYSPTQSSLATQGDRSALNLRRQDLNIISARKFSAMHDSPESCQIKQAAHDRLQDLQALANDVWKAHEHKDVEASLASFSRLACYFQGDPSTCITSAELLESNVVSSLLHALHTTSEHSVDRVQSARKQFVKVFNNPSEAGQVSQGSPIATLIHKLQDLLSRVEQFDVATVNQTDLDGSRTTASSMLSKQIRLRLLTSSSSGRNTIPKSFNNLTISIHAIATFKSLADYLRPRLSLAEKPISARHRQGISSALAAFAAAAGIPSLGADDGEDESQGDSTTKETSKKVIGKTEQSDVCTSSSGSPMSRESDAPLDTASTSKSSQYSQRYFVRAAVRKPLKDESSPSSTAQPTTTAPISDNSREASVAEDLDDEEDEALCDDDDGGLGALIDDIEDDMDDEEIQEPSAVNMEVTPAGKVTARKEDGTRVATPMHNQTSARATRISSLRNLDNSAEISTANAASKPMSYAAAVQSVPHDWHLEFSIDGQRLDNDTTIYKAVHQHKSQINPATSPNIWATIHNVHFRRVSGPPPSDRAMVSSDSFETTAARETAALIDHPKTSQILSLLHLLHQIYVEPEPCAESIHPRTARVETETLSHFVNTKLTAKMNRQLDEPLVVVSKSLPSWTTALALHYPFLFPFETRYLFLQSTSFGYARSMLRWQSQTNEEALRNRYRDERPFTGKLQRQKVRIQRQRILESAYKVLELYGSSLSMLEIEYFDEVGTGLGPTLEFYSAVSREFSKKKMRMWRSEEADDSDDFICSSAGMFPAPMTEEVARSDGGKKILQHFKMLGKFIARSMLDSRIIDVTFNPAFFKLVKSTSILPLTLDGIRRIDLQLAKSLEILEEVAASTPNSKTLHSSRKDTEFNTLPEKGVSIGDLGLDFTLPGYPGIELVKGGAKVAVSLENSKLYIERIIDMTIGSGVQRQLASFREGFSDVFQIDSLNSFTPKELVMLFGQTDEDWSIEGLCDSIKADHGYNMDSKSVRNLLQVMSKLSISERREFLQFVTGSPKLPIGGFKALKPTFTVVCKPAEAPYSSDDFLISVMTCANYVKLPDYSSIEVLRTKLMTAISEGQGAFHLS